MTKSQYEVLLEELDKVLISISKKEIKQILPQISVFLSEANVFGDYEEIDEPDQSRPTDILRGQLIFIYDNEELAKWYAIFALYLAKEIDKRNRQDDIELVHCAIDAINVAKQHLERVKSDSKLKAQGAKEHESKKGTKRSKKRYIALDEFKKIANKKYEPAIYELHAEGAAITYENIAAKVYPEIKHHNYGKSGAKLIGIEGDPVGSLVALYQKAVAAKKIESTIHYRKILSA